MNSLRRNHETTAMKLPHGALIAFVISFLLYLSTTAPTVYNLDSAELTTAAATRGLIRATGYPVYLLLGNAWSKIPLGDVGFRMNLFSAFCGALTIALAEIVLRRLRVGVWARLGALGLMATSRYFWAMSSVAEVYTLHTAFLCAILLAVLHWAEKPSPLRLGLATLCVGLAFGNHASTVLLAPGCLWMVLSSDRRAALTPRSLSLAAGGLLAGLSVYLYLPWISTQQPAFNYVGAYDATGQFKAFDLTVWQNFWWLVSGRGFAGQMMGYDLSGLGRETGHFVAELWRTFSAVGFGPGLLGLVLLWRQDRRLGGMLLLMFLANAWFFISYRVLDKDTMFLPAELIWALWLGIGYQWLLDLVKAPKPTPTWCLRGFLVATVLLALVWNRPLVDLSDDWSTRTRGESILRHVEPNALIVGYWTTAPIIQYLQLVEGQRPDVLAINRTMISAKDLRTLVHHQVQHRAIYFERAPSQLLPDIATEPAWPLVRLLPPESDRSIASSLGKP